MPYEYDQFIEMVKQLAETIETKQKDIAHLQAKYGIAVKRNWKEFCWVISSK